MRTVTAGAFISLDGVMQAPGGPEEDPTGGFRFGGWTAPYWDEVIGAFMSESFERPFDLLLGRRTYDIFAAHWPYVEADPAAGDFDALNHQVANTFNAATKYVATHRPESLTWVNSQALGADVAGRVRALKGEDGPDLLVQGSSELIHILMEADLIDTFRLLTYPLVLGHGKRLFGPGAKPGALRLARSAVSPRGVVMTVYERAGEIAVGSFTPEIPSQAELERRRTLN